MLPSRTAPEVVTYRLTFCKDGAPRWLAHLDVMRLFERAFRRCELPVALSQGFNPRPRIRFVLPSAVGVAARADVLFVDLLPQPKLSPEEVAQRLNSVLPDGVRVLAAEAIPDHARKAALRAYGVARYMLVFDCAPEVRTEELREAAAELAHEDMAVLQDAQGNTKQVPLGRFLTDIAVERPDAATAQVVFATRFGQEGTVRPSDMAALLMERVAGLTLRRMERLGLEAAPDGASHALLDGESRE